MENRLHPRVQCFHLNELHDQKPVWVFRHVAESSLLGLIIDISRGGAQVLTAATARLSALDYILIVHDDFSENVQLCALPVHVRWSKEEGGLYLRHGFEFQDAVNATGAVAALMGRVQLGHKWLRCELSVN